MSEIRHTLTVPIESAGHRLDQVVAGLLSEYSRTRIKEWIDAGQVLVNGSQLRPKDRVIGGERIDVRASIEQATEVLAEAIDLDVVHEDRHVLVVNKPAGLVVHPGAGNSAGTLQNALLHRDAKLAQLPRGGIVHRIDKDTSGLLVIARTLEAHTALVRAIEAHEVGREYEGICQGVMTGGGTVNAPIGRHPQDRVRMAIREPGREAITHYRVLRRFRGHTHVRLTLETGRTHQIRVHLAHVHYPLVGDRVYGGRLLVPKGSTPALVEALRGFKRQALHAARLTFVHPKTGKTIECEAPLPADLRALLATLASDAGGQEGGETRQGATVVRNRSETPKKASQGRASAASPRKARKPGKK